jgi:hypothetical protein
MKLGRPSPALVISIIALIVACTGTAFAATIINSSSQIKNGAVISADVKDGSLQSRDLRKGALTESRLSAGVVRKLSARAASSDATAFELVRKAGPEAQPANVGIRVATLPVPAGAYKVTAKTIMTALVPPQNPIETLLQNDAALGGRCRLDAAGDADESFMNIVITQRQTPATLTMQITRTVGEPADFTLDCAADVAWRLSETSIIATKVSNINRLNVDR